MGTNTIQRPDTQAALDGLRRIVRALRESSRWAERHVGLSGAQLFVLQKLAQAPAASVNELAARTHTHQSTVSMVVAPLVTRGLVRRTPSATDRRHVGLSLTARGRRTAAGTPDAPQERLIHAIDQLTVARRRQLASALTEVAHAIDGAEGDPVMFLEDRGRGRRARE
jgi:DNA-binding MarR family transcriptional regulator